MTGAAPRPGSVVHRKKLRQDVRNMLGTSRSDAPNALITLKALYSLAALLNYAADRRYSIQIVGPDGVETIGDAMAREIEGR